MIVELYDTDLSDPESRKLPARAIGFEHLSLPAQMAVRANGGGTFYRDRGTPLENYNAICPPSGDTTPEAIGDLRLGGKTSKEGCFATICAVIGEDKYQHLRVTRAQLQGLGEQISLFLSYTEPEASE